MKKRILSTVLAVVLIFSFALTVFAEYENTYVVTGNNAKDIVGVATTQIGYVEGENNYTKYGEWYGTPNVAWSATFVVWCADQAGVKTSVIPKFSSCEVGRKWFVDRDLYQVRGDYVPKAGDIVFFDWTTDGVADHMGIVEGTDGKYLIAIEGNSGDSVEKRTDTVYASVNILGYATPKYENNEVLPPVEKVLEIKDVKSKFIYYGDKLLLQAEIAEIPEGAELKWTVDGDAVTLSPYQDGMVCQATSVLKGEPTISVSLVDADGNVLKDDNGNDISDSVTIPSKVNFIWKLISWFKDFFDMSRIVY